MCLKLSCYQLKMDLYNSKIFHINLLVIRKQKPIVDTETTKRKESKHVIKIIKSQRKRSQKTMNKMAIVSPYLSTITLTVNELNSPIRRQRAVEWIKKARPNFMLPTKHSLQCKVSQRLKEKGLENTFYANGN